MPFPKRYILSLLTLIILVAGIYDYLKNFEDNGCEMTWMFEYPKYQKINIDKFADRFPKYGLYIYGEGEYARRISSLKLSGVPVLFIPGNAGSYRQVRSLGSVALRKAQSLNSKFEFNYFSIDFNEELVGVFGGVLQDQTEFVHECIKYILKFYEGAANRPTSVILVGHSMGGLVARGLFTLPDFDHRQVNTIITQASPHQAPPIAIDHILAGFYRKINTYWKEHASDTLRDVTVVSTGGGYRDILVRNDLTSLRGIVEPHRSVSTSTMSVPRSWVSTDHLCAVWCRQMVLVTKRALFDIIDPTTKQVTIDADKRMRVFRHHFLSNPGSARLTEVLKEEITLDSKIPFEIHDEKLFIFKAEKMSASKYFAIPIIREPEDDISSIDSLVILSNLTADNWVCTCKMMAKEERCKSCLNLSPRAQSLPPLYSNKRAIKMDHKELGEATHIVILAGLSRNKVEIIVEQYTMVNRHLIFGLPGWYDTLISYPVSVLDMAAMLQIRNNSVYYSLHLAGLEGPLRAYTAHIIPRRCRKLATADYEGMVYTLNVPWSNESTYGFTKYNEKGTLPVKLQSSKVSGSGDDAVHLEMFLHPSCSYQLKISASPMHVVGQFIRFYAGLYPSFFIAVLVLTLAGHFTQMAAGEVCSQISEAVFTQGKPFRVIPLVMLFRFFVSFKQVEKQLTSLGLPADDKDSLDSQGLWFPAVMPLMGASAFLITILQVRVLQTGCYIKSTLSSLIFGWLPEGVLNLSVYIEVCACIIGVIAAFTTCGTVAIFLSYMVIGSKVLWLCRKSAVSKLKEDESKYSFYFILVLLYLWLLVLNAPSLVVWSKNLSFSPKLTPDPSRLTGLVVSLVTLLYSVNDNINFNGATCQGVVWLLYPITALSLVYAMVSVYRLSFIITLVLVITCIPKIEAMTTPILFPPKRKDE